MKSLAVFVLFTFALPITTKAESTSGYRHLITACDGFTIVNVLPAWRYYDSGLNAYITKSTSAEMPLKSLNSVSASFEQDYNVTASGKDLLVAMSRFNSEIAVNVELNAPVDLKNITEGSYSSEVVIGNLYDQYADLFGSFQNQTFLCRSEIVKYN